MKKLFKAIFATLVLLLLTNPSGASLILIRFETTAGTFLPGDSPQKDFSGKDGWSQIDSSSLEIEVTAPVSGSANGGRATIKSIGIGKDINALSPAIFQRLALNQVMYQVEIVHANADNSGSAKIFLLQRFRNVVLTKLKHVGTATSANDPAKEALEISCTKYFTEYTSYNASGSTSKTSAGFAFDTLANWNGL